MQKRKSVCFSSTNTQERREKSKALFEHAKMQMNQPAREPASISRALSKKTYIDSDRSVQR